jgi:hypothetical protein
MCAKECLIRALKALTLTHGLGVCIKGFGCVESRLQQNIQSWFFKEESLQSV